MVAGTDAYLPAEQLRKKRLRSLVTTVILVSVGVHVVAGIIAGAVIVARYFAEPPAEFKLTKDVRLPAQEREHKMNMAAFDGMAPKPSFTDKMQSLRPAAFSLPDLPKVPMEQVVQLDTAALVSDQVSSLVGTAGLGGGGTAAGGMGGTSEGFSFFGVQSKGRRILMLFDVSSSVVNKAGKAGVPLSKIKEETLELIEGLGANARFGIIQFTQNFQPFQSELVAATAGNKELAVKWVKDEWVETGMMSSRKKSVVSNDRGFAGVLEFALKLEPDVIFVISDGSFQWREGGGNTNIPEKDLRDALKGAAGKAEIPVNFLGFEMKTEDRNFWRRTARQTGGQFRELDQ